MGRTFPETLSLLRRQRNISQRQAAAEQLFADGRGRFEPERHRADGEGRVFLLKLHSRRAEREKRGLHRGFIGRVKREIKSGLLRRAHLL